MKDTIRLRASLLQEIREYKQSDSNVFKLYPADTKKKEAMISAMCLNFILIGGLNTVACSCDNYYTDSD